MIQVIAQGMGYYGLAFFTTSKSTDEVKKAMERAGLKLTATEYVGADDATETEVMVKEAHPDLIPQPKPVVLFDTGHSDLDLDILNRIKSELEI